MSGYAKVLRMRSFNRVRVLSPSDDLLMNVGQNQMIFVVDTTAGLPLEAQVHLKTKIIRYIFGSEPFSFSTQILVVR
jgi:hypothetical protein